MILTSYVAPKSFIVLQHTVNSLLVGLDGWTIMWIAISDMHMRNVSRAILDVFVIVKQDHRTKYTKMLMPKNNCLHSLSIRYKFIRPFGHKARLPAISVITFWGEGKAM